MVNYCGNCGSRLDEKTGLCPKCDKEKLSNKKRKIPRIPLAYIIVCLILAIALLFFIPKLFPSGGPDVVEKSSCIHKWKPATCEQAKTCTLCGAVEGDPLSHVPGTWTEDLDLISCKLVRSVNCKNCGIQLEREEVTLDSFVKDNTFVFTPQQFIDRFTHIVKLKFGLVSYEVVPSDYGMFVNLYYGEGQKVMLNFLHSDITAVSDKELDQNDICCVSAFFLSRSEEDKVPCMEEFFKACDPKLDSDTAYIVTSHALSVLENALDEGNVNTTFQYNNLSYDVTCSSADIVDPSYDIIFGLSAYPAGIEAPEKGQPVLRSDYEVPSDGGEALPSYSVFGSDIEKERIASMKFLDTLSGAPRDAWDVSEAGDGSVLAWVKPRDSERYDLFIAGEGGVWAPEDCTYLFAEYRWMESLDFNNVFFVDNCKTMLGMFYHNQFLTELDFNGWDTSNVENMSEMFYFCSSLEQLDLSQFNTSSVTNMRAMFMRCETMKELDLSPFDTSSVTDMSSMFFQSWALEELNLGSFDTSRVADISMMFFSCESLKKLDISSFDTSSVEESMAIFSGGIHLSELKIGPKFDVSILREAADDMPFMAEGGTLNGYPWETFLKQ